MIRPDPGSRDLHLLYFQWDMRRVCFCLPGGPVHVRDGVLLRTWPVSWRGRIGWIRVRRTSSPIPSLARGRILITVGGRIIPGQGQGCGRIDLTWEDILQ